MRKIHRMLSKKIKDMEFRRKLIVTFFIIGVFPMLILGIFSYVQTRKLLVKQEENSMHDFIVQSTMSMENQIQIYNNLSDYIAYNQTISQIISYDYNGYYDMYKQFTNVLDPMLTSVKYFNADVNQLTIYNNRDIEKHDTTLAPLTEIENEDWYSKIYDNNRQIMWIIDKDNNRAFSVRKMPLLDASDDKGILYIDVSYDKLFESFKQMTNDNYGVYILDEDGNVIFEYSDFDEEHQSEILDYDQLEIEIEINKGRDETSYTIVSETTDSDWQIILYKPNKAISDSIWSMILLVILVTLCCIGGSAVISAYLSRIIVSDIEKLTKNMKEVEAGNLVINVTSDSKDEVGNLITGFGNMINRINTLINENYKGEISQKESEMRALQAQINPHFLYNSLSLINWKALETDQQDISRLTLLLSTFYRTALNKGDNILSIRDELSNVKSYIDIQLMMHDNEFDVVMDVDEDILEYSTLNLLLQPLVENAIDHGIDLKTEGRGVITISGKSEGDKIILAVGDNGIGMNEVQVASMLTKQSRGYGIRNVHERIRLLFGKEYGLKTKSEIGVGTTVEVIIPKRTM